MQALGDQELIRQELQLWSFTSLLVVHAWNTKYHVRQKIYCQLDRVDSSSLWSELCIYATTAIRNAQLYSVPIAFACRFGRITQIQDFSAVYIGMFPYLPCLLRFHRHNFSSTSGRAFHDEALHRLLGCSAGRFQRLDWHANRWNTTILRFRELAWLPTQETLNPSTRLCAPQPWRIARFEYFVWLHSHGTRLGQLLQRWWQRMLAQGTKWEKI